MHPLQFSSPQSFRSRATGCLALLLVGVWSILIPAPVAAKTVGELALECSQATALRSNRNPVGIDPYQIATCFAYLEAHIDLRPQRFCLPATLDMTELAGLLLISVEPYPASANASEALMETLPQTYPCLE